MTRSKTRRPARRRQIRAYLAYALLASLLVVSLLAVHFFVLGGSGGQSNSTGPTDSTDSAEGDATLPQFDKTQYSISDPTSPWVVVNKGRQLPSNYVPSNLMVPAVALRYSSGTEMRLRAQAGKALEQMFKAAANDGVKLMVASAYRSYSLQSSVYNRHVNQLGRSAADKVSARPGHSEHQSGWSLDVAPTSGKCLITECFGELAEGQWVSAHAHSYGFLIRYPEGSQLLTGYSYEPWHIRFVGTDLADELYRSSQTLEQFFGLPAQPTYPADIVEL